MGGSFLYLQMSILSDFVNAMAPAAQEVIGTLKLSIAGGTAIDVTPGEHNASRDYETGGFDTDEETTVQVLTPIFTDAYNSDFRNYRGKTATLDGKTWRVDSIHKGQYFTAIRLTSTTVST